MVENKLENVWATTLQSLTYNDVDFIVVGGAAMALHGIPRHTLDIDLFVPATQPEIQKLFSVLGDKLKMRCRQEGVAQSSTPELAEGHWATFCLPNGPDLVDVFFENPATYQNLKLNALHISISSVAVQGSTCFVKIISLSDIKRMKLECGRPVDLADAALIDDFVDAMSASNPEIGGKAGVGAKVLIRCYGDAKFGLGHVHRSMTLCRALRRNGVSPVCILLEKELETVSPICFANGIPIAPPDGHPRPWLSISWYTTCRSSSTTC